MRQAFFEGDQLLSQRWPYSTDPAIYLSQWPDGPRAQLARQVVDEVVTEYRKHFDATLRAVEASFRVLADRLGSDLHDDPPDRGTTHTVLKQLLLKTHVPLDFTVIRSKAGRVFFAEEGLFRRRIIRAVGVRLGRGSLGPSQNWPVRPRYWKGKRRPGEFLWSSGYRLAGREKVMLAKAVVAPFEDAIAEELTTIEGALRAALVAGPDANRVYRTAIEMTRTTLFFTRYRQCYSMEFWSAVQEWTKQLSLESAAPPFPRVGDLRYAHGSQSQAHS